MCLINKNDAKFPLNSGLSGSEVLGFPGLFILLTESVEIPSFLFQEPINQSQKM